MNRVLISTIAAASLLLGALTTPAAFAQTSSAATMTSTSAKANHDTSMGRRGHRAMHEMRDATPEERAVARSIMRLERVYMSQGRVNDIKPLLDNVKRNNSNPNVIAFVDSQLDRLAKRPTNPDQQIATLTQKLNDKIAKLQ